MKSMKKISKIIAVSGIIALLAGSLAGCSTQKDAEIAELKTSIETLETSGEAVSSKLSTAQDKIIDIQDELKLAIENDESDDKTINDLNTKIETLKISAATDKQIIEDYKVEVENLIEETAETTNEGLEVIDDLALNQNIGVHTLDDSDVTKLIDGQIEFGGEDYSVQEKIVLDGLSVKTSIDNDDFGSDVFVTVDNEGAISYKYVFDDKITLADIKNDPLEIKFLGKNVKIVDANDDKITIEDGTETMIYEYTEKIVDGVVIEAAAITNGGVQFIVNGESITLDIGDTEKVGDIEVKLIDTFDNEAAEGGSDFATILVGADVEKTLENDNKYIEDDERFIFGIDSNDGKLENLTVTYDVTHTDVDDDEYKPLKEGESISFPNDYFKVSFDGITDSIYEDYTLDFKTYKSEKNLRITGNIEIGSDEVDKVYFNGNEVKYEDENGDDQVADITDVKIVNDDTILDLDFNAITGILSVGPLDIVVDAGFTYFGTEDGESEADEIKYGTKSIGNRDNDVVLTEGIVVKSPDNNGDNDKIKLLVPDTEIEGTIFVG